MTYACPKSFFKIWLSQIVANNAFIQDCRITSDNIGRASAGDLPSLRDILVVYANYIDLPAPQSVGNIFPGAWEQKQIELYSIIPPSERRQSILDFIALIESNSIEIIE